MLLGFFSTSFNIRDNIRQLTSDLIQEDFAQSRSQGTDTDNRARKRLPDALGEEQLLSSISSFN
jgi:hypothetical protein